MLESGRGERSRVHRRQRLYPERHLPERGVPERHSRNVHRQRSMSRGRHVQHEHGRVLEPERQRRHGVYGEQQVQPGLRLRRRGLHRLEPRHVHGERPVPRRWDMRSHERHMLESCGGQRRRLQRRQRLHAD